MGEELFDVNLNSLDMQEEAIDVAEFTQPPAEDTPADEVELEDSTEETTTDEVVNKETKEETKKEDLIDIPTGENNNTTDSEDKIETPDNEADSSPILPFASLLQEKGFLPHLDMDEFSNEEDPVDALTSAIRNEISIANESFINSFPKELIDMAKAVANGVPVSQLKESKLKELEYTTIREDKLAEDVNLQKKLVRNYLKEKGFKDAKIEREVTRYEDLGDLETEAKDALEELKTISKEKQEYAKYEYAERQKQLEAQNKQLLGNIHNSIETTEEIIPGLKMNKTVKDNIYATMTQIVDQDANGTPMNGIMSARAQDPVAFDTVVSYLINITSKNGKPFTDWGKLGRVAKTNAAKDLERALQKGTPIIGKPKSIHKDSDGIDPLEGLKYI
tara:strand:- start:9371 stop:10543 length:1173 start_codon:yes stop_codon:yes gene_type:complete